MDASGEAYVRVQRRNKRQGSQEAQWVLEGVPRRLRVEVIEVVDIQHVQPIAIPSFLQACGEGSSYLLISTMLAIDQLK